MNIATVRSSHAILPNTFTHYDNNGYTKMDFILFFLPHSFVISILDLFDDIINTVMNSDRLM